MASESRSKGTNYNEWEKKGKAMEAELDAEEKAQKEIDDAVPIEGPPVAKAQEEKKEMDKNTDERKEMIQKLTAMEVVVSSPEDCADLAGKAVRISKATGKVFKIPDRVLKVFVEKCTDCVIQVGDVITSSLEVHQCSSLVLEYESLGTMQVDSSDVELRCSGVRLGDVYHHMSTVHVSLAGREKESVVSTEAQMITRGDNEGITSNVVMRTVEGEYPADDANAAVRAGPCPIKAMSQGQPAQQDASAEILKGQGNDAFRANDFNQAAALYTLALTNDPTMHVAFANRSQCWLKMGQLEKALADAEECIKIEPKFVKGHFRKGLCLHAMKRYGDAIGALLEAEKLDDKNQQVKDSIKMAQMMAHKHGAAPL